MVDFNSNQVNFKISNCYSSGTLPNVSSSGSSIGGIKNVGGNINATNFYFFNGTNNYLPPISENSASFPNLVVGLNCNSLVNVLATFNQSVWGGDSLRSQYDFNPGITLCDDFIPPSTLTPSTLTPSTFSNFIFLFYLFYLFLFLFIFIFLFFYFYFFIFIFCFLFFVFLFLFFYHSTFNSDTIHSDSDIICMHVQCVKLRKMRDNISSGRSQSIQCLLRVIFKQMEIFFQKQKL